MSFQRVQRTDENELSSCPRQRDAETRRIRHETQHILALLRRHDRGDHDDILLRTLKGVDGRDAHGFADRAEIARQGTSNRGGLRLVRYDHADVVRRKSFTRRALQRLDPTTHLLRFRFVGQRASSVGPSARDVDGNDGAERVENGLAIGCARAAGQRAFVEQRGRQRADARMTSILRSKSYERRSRAWVVRG